MRPVCFHQPCKIDPVNRAGSLDIGEKQGRLFGALCDDSERVIGPLHAFDFNAGRCEHFLRNYANARIVFDNEHGLGHHGSLRL